MYCLESQSSNDSLTAPFSAVTCRNPVWVARIIAAIPKVAEYSNLGLWAATPLELKPPFAIQLSTRCRKVSVELPTRAEISGELLISQARSHHLDRYPIGLQHRVV